MLLIKYFEVLNIPICKYLVIPLDPEKLIVHNCVSVYKNGTQRILYYKNSDGTVYKNIFDTSTLKEIFNSEILNISIKDINILFNGEELYWRG